MSENTALMDKARGYYEMIQTRLRQRAQNRKDEREALTARAEKILKTFLSRGKKGPAPSKENDNAIGFLQLALNILKRSNDSKNEGEKEDIKRDDSSDFIKLALKILSQKLPDEEGVDNDSNILKVGLDVLSKQRQVEESIANETQAMITLSRLAKIELDREEEEMINSKKYDLVKLGLQLIEKMNNLKKEEEENKMEGDIDLIKLGVKILSTEEKVAKEEENIKNDIDLIKLGLEILSKDINKTEEDNYLKFLQVAIQVLIESNKEETFAQEFIRFVHAFIENPDIFDKHEFHFKKREIYVDTSTKELENAWYTELVEIQDIIKPKNDEDNILVTQFISTTIFDNFVKMFDDDSVTNEVKKVDLESIMIDFYNILIDLQPKIDEAEEDDDDDEESEEEDDSMDGGADKFKKRDSVKIKDDARTKFTETIGQFKETFIEKNSVVSALKTLIANSKIITSWNNNLFTEIIKDDKYNRDKVDEQERKSNLINWFDSQVKYYNYSPIGTFVGKLKDKAIGRVEFDETILDIPLEFLVKIDNVEVPPGPIKKKDDEPEEKKDDEPEEKKDDEPIIYEDNLNDRIVKYCKDKLQTSSKLDAYIKNNKGSDDLFRKLRVVYILTNGDEVRTVDQLNTINFHCVFKNAIDQKLYSAYYINGSICHFNIYQTGEEYPEECKTGRSEDKPTEKGNKPIPPNPPPTPPSPPTPPPTSPRRPPPPPPPPAPSKWKNLENNPEGQNLIIELFESYIDNKSKQKNILREMTRFKKSKNNDGANTFLTDFIIENDKKNREWKKEPDASKVLKAFLAAK